MDKYISRAKVLESIRNNFSKCIIHSESVDHKTVDTLLSFEGNLIHDIFYYTDSVTMDERQLGTWEGKTCSECGYYSHYVDYKTFRYCPSCGARMYGSDDEDDLK